MKRNMLKSKIHRITVTDANLEYEGSVTLDPEFMDIANIAEYEAVHIWDVTNGARIQTYAIRGKWGSRECCINGGAAHLIKKNDVVVIATFVDIDNSYAHSHKPTIMLMEECNSNWMVTRGTYFG